MRVKSNKSLKNIFLLSCALGASSSTSIAYATNVEKLESRIVELERTLQKQESTQAQQNKKIQTIEQQSRQRSSAMHTLNSNEDSGLSVFGSFRPAITATDIGTSTSTDITDSLSYAGISGQAKVGNNTHVFFTGEWGIDIAEDADFGDARLAYVGVEGDFGRVAIGKQWNPHYKIASEVTDIFNNRASPFGYDNTGPFRVNNLVTYSYKKSGFIIDTSIQIDGSQDGVNHVDMGSAGIAYKNETFYIGGSYLVSKEANNFEQTQAGAAVAITFSESLYFALSYQDIDTDPETLLTPATTSLAGSTLDAVMSYEIANATFIKSAYFQYDDGLDTTSSLEHTGFNLTVEKRLTPKVKIFAEWLRRDYEQADEVDAFSIGMHYDFSLDL